jgi:calcineurin-like phosphoesterase family protein
MNSLPHTRIWVHSDLQLAEPSQAETTLATAVDDLLEQGLKLDAVWCLGDAHCGTNEASLQTVAAINVAQLRRLRAPVYYVLGNHEMDLTASGVRRFPLHDLVTDDADWRVAALDEFYFCAEFGGFLVVFMGDHAAREGGWWTAHGYANGDDYPHSSERYDALRQKMRDHNGPVVIASHYALPGGQRSAPLMERLLPLPENVRLHLHGHAHIGDLVWNKENPWQRANPVTGHKLKQFNISALESVRTPGSHSALLELYPDGAIALRIRCHLEKQWVEEFRI